MIVVRLVRRIITAVISFLTGRSSQPDRDPHAPPHQQAEWDLDAEADPKADVAPEAEAVQESETGGTEVALRGKQPLEKPHVRPLPATPFGESVDLVRERSRQISEPIDLEELAAEVTQTVGATQTHNWFGYEDFGRFLAESLPNAEIGGQNSGALSPDRDESQDDVLPAIRYLRSNMDNFPQQVEIDDWRPMYLALEQALPKVRGSGKLQPKMVYAWTKIARDRTEAGASCHPKRNWLNYVALNLYKRKLVHRGLDHTEIENAFVDLCGKEMRKSGLPPLELARGEAWLRSYPDPHFESKPNS